MKKKTTNPVKIRKEKQRKENGRKNIYVFPKKKSKFSFPYFWTAVILLIIAVFIFTIVLTQKIHEVETVFTFTQIHDTVAALEQSGYKLTGVHAKQVLDQWDKYEKLIQQAESVSKENLHIDVISFLHDFPEAVNQYQAEQKIKKSQHKTYDLLIKLHPDIMTFEGSGLARVTFDTFIDETEEGIHKQGASMPREEIIRVINEEIDKGLDAVYRFLKENKDVLIIGQEEEEVLILHNQVINIYGADSLESRMISHLRTKIAIAKLIMALSENKKSHGLIPIGFMHAISCKKKLERLKVSYKIYSTVD